MAIIGALPFNFQNGTVADASQVDANLNSIASQVNNNAANAGVNTNITSLTGLTTPLSPAQGGGVVYEASTYTGSTAAALVIPLLVPSGFSLNPGNIIFFIAPFTSTGAMTIAVNGTPATTAKRRTSAANTFSDIQQGDVTQGMAYAAYYDGTYWQMITLPSTAITNGNIDNTVIGQYTPAAGNFTTGNFTTGNFINLNTTGAITFTNTNIGNVTTAFTTINNSSTAGTASLIALQPSAINGKAVLINAINDGSDNIEMLFYTSITGASQQYRGGFKAAGGFLVGQANNRPSGTCNDGDANIAGYYRIQGSQLPVQFSFQSVQQAIALAGAITVAHGLPRAPTLIQIEAINITAEGGYNPGDRTILNPSSNDPGGSDNAGLAVTYDATNVYIRIGNQSFGRLINKSNGTVLVTTPANWNLVIKAFA